jgi:hypothetical protein
MKNYTVKSAVISILFLTAVHGSTDSSYATRASRATVKHNSSIDQVQKYENERKLSAWWNLFSLGKFIVEEVSQYGLHLNTWMWVNWLTLSSLQVHGPCLPGKPGEKCRKEHDQKAASDAGSTNYDSSGSDYSGSGSSGSDYSGSDSSRVSSSSTENGGGGGSSGTGSGAIGKFVNSPAGTATIITLSAVAASVAIAAMLLASKRRKNEGERHALHGTLKRRIGMFQHLASRTKCMTCRPERASEKVDNSADYRLA